MSMIESFFDLTRDSGEVFIGLNITKHEKVCGISRKKITPPDTGIQRCLTWYSYLL